MDAQSKAWVRAEISQGRRAARLPLALGAAQVLGGVAQAICAAQLLAAVLGFQPGGATAVGYVIGFALFALARAALQMQAERLGFERGAAARRRLRSQVLSRLLAAGPTGLRDRHSGELAAMAIDRVEAMEGLHARWIPATALAVIGPALVGVAALLADWRSGLILLVAGLLVPVAMAVAGIGAGRAATRQFTAMTRLQVRFLDRIRGISTIVLGGQAAAEALRLGQAAEELRRRTMRVLRVAFLSSTVLDLAMAAALVAILVRFGGAHAITSLAPRALFVLLLVPEFFSPLRGFAAVYQDRMAAGAAAETLAQLPPAVAEVPAAEIRSVAAQGVTLAFEDVVFAWNASRGDVLDRLSFRVAAGETLLLTGASGSGKSTIIDLILGFIAPHDGRITINGAELATLVPAARNRMIGWIGQKPMIFAGSIADNIRFGRPEASEDDVTEAIRLARLTDTVAALPQGLDTPVGEGGFGLSGGQAQRLAIARAFLKDAPLLLLDEPTAHLDPATERDILASIRRLGIGRTVILASHSTQAIDFARNTGARRLDLDALAPRPPARRRMSLARTGGPAGIDPVRRILRLWRPHAVYLGLGAVIAMAALAAGLALMGAAGHAIGLLLLAAAVAAPAALPLLGVARVVLRYAERLVTHDAMFRALASLRVWFFSGLAGSAAGGLGLAQAGDALARLVNDVEALDGLYLRILLPLLGALLILPVLAVLLGLESLWALPALLPFLAVACYLPWRAARLAGANAGRAGLAMAGLRSTVLDALTGRREVSLFAAEGRMLATAQAREAALLAAQREQAAAASRLNAVTFVAAQAAILIAILAGFTTATPLAALVAVFVLIAALEAVAGLPRAGLLFGQAEAAAARVVAAATAGPLVPEPAAPAAMPGSHAIAFEHVGFRYAPDRPFVFENLTLQLPAGSRTAIIGPSGAGKSTIAALLLKLIAPVQGRIRLGAVDLAALPAEAVRARIAYLSQHTHLFADSIRNNLALGDPSAGDDQLWAALEAAQLADTVRALPDGLDHWLDEGGGTLSGGQGRRLALARTLLSNAPILLLDEPAAGLDAATEAAFMKTLSAATEGRTVVMILHRLTGAEQLDRIWRLTGGALVAATG